LIVVRPFSSSASRRQASIVALAALFAAAAALAVGGARLADEWVHYRQVEWFASGHYAVVEELTTIPGFHAIVALVHRAFGGESVGLSRSVTMVFAVIAALGFASIRRALAPTDDPSLPTLQFIFFPILFPFCFLLYTDVPSLALVLWAFRYSLDRRHLAAGALGIAALFVRQTNIVWIGCIALLQMAPLLSPGVSWRARLRAAIALWPYAAGIAVFAGYWLWHGSVSLSRSQARAHPDLALHSGNLFFMLLLIGIFFLPLMPIWLSRYARSVMARPALLALPVLLGVLYATTFKVDHPYNFTLPEIILRNSVLVLVAQNRYAFVAFGVVAVAAACAISQVRWQRPSFILILLVSMLFVSASWLIEQRYYLIPIALLLALRVTENRRAERMLLALWMPVAVGFLYGMLSYQFFL
jgi:alpha-1,2-glucosyltransferase